MSKFVGVHGIWQQQKGRNQLIDQWRPALADGLERATGAAVALPDLEIAFYGGLFTPPAKADSKSGPVTEVWLSGVGEAELADLAAATSDIVSDGVLAAADHALAESKGPPALPLRLQRLARAIDLHIGLPVGVLYLSELRQVRRYLCEPDVKQAADEIVAEAIGADCQVLIGHSLGSVVAFEYVRQHPKRPLDLLLTLGSPLALRMVRARLPVSGRGEESGVPASVGAWVNVRDPRDPVACAGDLRPHWPGVFDIAVNNELDAHSIQRYLSKKATGAAIIAAVPGWST